MPHATIKNKTMACIQISHLVVIFIQNSQVQIRIDTIHSKVNEMIKHYKFSGAQNLVLFSGTKGINT